MWIEMTLNMSGTRANGDRYPPAWTAFEVADWEGEHLVKGGMARPARPPAKAPDKEPEKPAAPEPVPPAPVSQPSGTAAGPVPVNPAAGPPPPPNASKDTWVDYAVSQGMDGDAASRATKAELQSRFGSRL